MTVISLRWSSQFPGDEPLEQPVVPGINGQPALRHPEAGADLVVDVNLCGFARSLPCREQRQAAVGHVEVGRTDRDEERRRVRGHVDVVQRWSVERYEKIRRRVRPLGERSPYGDPAAGGESDDADARGIDTPALCIPTRQ